VKIFEKNYDYLLRRRQATRVSTLILRATAVPDLTYLHGPSTRTGLTQIEVGEIGLDALAGTQRRSLIRCLGVQSAEDLPGHAGFQLGPCDPILLKVGL
jgi:hypothetical protein